MRLIEKVWFYQHPAKWCLVPLLLPLSALFWLISSIRRLCYQWGIKKAIRCNIPVVVVGNLGVGGNGKTPLVLMLVERLSKQGLKVGVISRGYGGKADYYPYQLTTESTAKQAGDEPILIYQRTGIPVVVGSDRIASVKVLEQQGCQIVICDDGLQHYRLARDYQFIVVDGKRLFGNGLLLPAGPLREVTSRINQANCIIVNGNSCNDKGELVASLSQKPVVNMQLQAQRLVNIKTGEAISTTEFLSQHDKVNAMAGIGDPQRFFDYLIQLEFKLNTQKGFVDHQAFSTDDLTQFDNDIPLVMTEKDAVKCTGFAQQNWWYLPVDANLPEQAWQTINNDLVNLIKS